MIPQWGMAGVLPPIRPGQKGVSLDRSPYVVPLWHVVDRFSTSPERTLILEGLLNYRAALHNLGVVSGMQWLDGSFTEDVENQDGRHPKDIDVVTWFHLPPGETELTLFAKAGDIFRNPYVKKNYLVDAYPLVLQGAIDGQKIRNVSYWYSMWSHKRSGLWKGFLQVDLSPHEDVAASKTLAAVKAGGSK